MSDTNISYQTFGKFYTKKIISDSFYSKMDYMKKNGLTCININYRIGLRQKFIEFRAEAYRKIKLCPVDPLRMKCTNIIWKYIKNTQTNVPEQVRHHSTETLHQRKVKKNKNKNDVKKTWGTLKGIIFKNRIKWEYSRYFIDKGQQIKGEKYCWQNLMNILHESDWVWQIQLISPIR